MLKSYTDYWKQHHPPCVGMVRVENRIASIHADGSWKTRWWVRLVPKATITYNRKGLCVTISSLKKACGWKS